MIRLIRALAEATHGRALRPISPPPESQPGLCRTRQRVFSMTGLAGAAMTIVALSQRSLADIRNPYLPGGGGAAGIAMLGFLLSLSIAVAGLWFFWYRRRGGSRLKSWIIASVIAVSMFLLIGVVTTLVV